MISLLLFFVDLVNKLERSERENKQLQVDIAGQTAKQEVAQVLKGRQERVQALSNQTEILASEFCRLPEDFQKLVKSFFESLQEELADAGLHFSTQQRVLPFVENSRARSYGNAVTHCSRSSNEYATLRLQRLYQEIEQYTCTLDKAAGMSDVKKATVNLIMDKMRYCIDNFERIEHE